VSGNFVEPSVQERMGWLKNSPAFAAGSDFWASTTSKVTEGVSASGGGQELSFVRELHI